jgi:hypothetical protein
VPASIPLSLPSANTTSSPSISSRLPRCSIVHHFSSTIYSHEPGWNMSAIFPQPLQTTIPTVLSWLDFRAVLLRHTILHGPSSSLAHRVQGEDSPEACSHFMPTIYMHTQVDLPTSRLNGSFLRLVVLRANSYGIPLWEFQILILRFCAHLVQIAANLVKAPLPPLDLHYTPCFTNLPGSSQPPPSAPTGPEYYTLSSTQDNLLSCLQFHCCAALISLVFYRLRRVQTGPATQ